MPVEVGLEELLKQKIITQEQANELGKSDYFKQAVNNASIRALLINKNIPIEKFMVFTADNCTLLQYTSIQNLLVQKKLTVDQFSQGGEKINLLTFDNILSMILSDKITIEKYFSLSDIQASVLRVPEVRNLIGDDALTIDQLSQLNVGMSIGLREVRIAKLLFKGGDNGLTLQEYAKLNKFYENSPLEFRDFIKVADEKVLRNVLDALKNNDMNELMQRKIVHPDFFVSITSKEQYKQLMQPTVLQALREQKINFIEAVKIPPGRELQKILQLNEVVANTYDGSVYAGPVVNQPELKKHAIHALPDRIKESELNKNGLIVSDKEKEAMNAYAAQVEGNVVVSRKDKTKNPRGIFEHSFVKIDGEVFAVRRGDSKKDKYLGKGGFGKVPIAQNINTGEFCVIKIMKAKIKTANRPNPTENEKARAIDFHKKIVAEEARMNKLLTKVGDYVDVEKSDDVYKSHMVGKLIVGRNIRIVIAERDMAWQEAKTCAMLGLPYENNSQYSAFELLKVAEGMFSRVHELNVNGLVHRDLKPDNMLLMPRSMDVGLIDWGQAHFLDFVRKDVGEMGTQGFQAPEVAPSMRKDGKSAYSEASDKFALGVSLAQWLGLRIDSEVNPCKIGPTEMFEEFFPDENVRKKLIGMVSTLTESNPKERNVAHDYAEDLRKLQSELTFSHQRDKTVAVVNIDEYTNMSTKEQKILREALKGFNQVVLVHDEKSTITPSALTALQSSLAKMGINCIDQAYSFNSEQRFLTLALLQKELDNDNPRSNMHVFQVSNKQNLLFDLSDGKGQRIVVDKKIPISNHMKIVREKYQNMPVSEEDMVKIRKMLIGEIARVREKYGKGSKECNAREFVIEQARIEVGCASNYANLTKGLQKLEIEMSKIKRHALVPVLFQTKSHTSKLIAQIAEDVTPKTPGKR